MKKEILGKKIGYVELFTILIVGSLTGFGQFWLLRLLDTNVFVSIFGGLLMTSATSILLIGLIVQAYKQLPKEIK